MRAPSRFLCAATLSALLVSAVPQQPQQQGETAPCSYSIETTASGRINYELTLDVPITECPWDGQNPDQQVEFDTPRPCVYQGTADSLDEIGCITTECEQSRKHVFFFDVDNCLYSKSTKVAQVSDDLADKYIEEHFSMSPRDAEQLRLNYSRNHGLLIEGLVRDLQVDPLDYYRKVDDAVPLDSLIRPNPQLRRLLEDIDKSKVKLWMFTNAYVNHAKRVVKLLGVADLFEGITYCDYGEAADNEILACKPRRESFERAMKESNAASVEDCFFVDDTVPNVQGAEAFGWNAVHFDEAMEATPLPATTEHRIGSLEELRRLFPSLFKTNQPSSAKAP